jgi:hypothetical protein
MVATIRGIETMNAQEFETALENGRYAWPGGYPLYFIMGDGEAVAFSYIAENASEARAAIANSEKRDEWFPVAVAVNWEDSDLICGATGARIESAYCEA